MNKDSEYELLTRWATPNSKSENTAELVWAVLAVANRLNKLIETIDRK